MEVFRDLLVTATPEQMAAVVAAIEKAPPSDWTVDTALGARLNAASITGKRSRVYYFTRKQDHSRPAVTLAIMAKDDDPGRYFVPNIVPTTSPSLTRGVYNATLEDFVARVFKPAADVLGVPYRLTDSQAELEHWLTKDTADKLREFSATANRAVGAALPEDRAKWNAFVLAAHKEGSRLDAATLVRWLVVVDQWDTEVAEQLALEYEYGRELLGFSSSRGGI
jgi:hypothetical protein